ncbi:YecR family lipoprotein [Neisseria zoodegmatis]|uniref:YecR family lipoprotein n=1 Tax=Neisseria zoodegmatis TaxID=326523 RepID=UPI000E0FD98A|nr:YecR family lipoprotein [Neisseria zoodegmatis]
MKKILLPLVVLLAVSACAIPTHKELIPTGGSKADGIIELSFEHTENEKPIIDEMAALDAAQKRCRAWGYDRAEKFGGHKRQCTVTGGFTGCFRSLITVQYQCLDKVPMDN